jgi:hypothetical protein
MISRSKRIAIWAFLSAFSLTSEAALGACISLVQGAVAIDVQACRDVTPEDEFKAGDGQHAFIKDLDSATRKKFLDTYRGALVKGKIARSKAIRSGLSKEVGVLLGETVSVYLPPQSLKCDKALGSRVAGVMKEVCCDGGGTAPCLLGTGYVIQSPQSFALTPLAEKGPMKSKVSKNSADYAKGEELYKKKKFRDAAKFLERSKAKSEIDTNGHFMLADSYRRMDQCNSAMPSLRYLQLQTENRDLWEGDREVAQKGLFLLARCLARLGKAPDAVLILNSYLAEPRSHQKEIRESLRHPDFGYINASKEYIEYKAEARKYIK